MKSTSTAVVTEARKNFRITDKLPIRWHFKGSQKINQGKVLNISTSGMLFEAELDYTPAQRCLFMFEALVQGRVPFIPQAGRLVWAEKKPFSTHTYRCGVEFVEPGEKVISKLRDRIQQKIIQLTNARKFQVAVGAWLFLTMVGLSAYVLREQNSVFEQMLGANRSLSATADQQGGLYRNYLRRYNETRVALAKVSDELAVTKRDLALNVKELSTTKALLLETEKMVQSLKTHNTTLARKMAVTDQGKLENQLAALRLKNEKYASEVKALADELKAYQGTVGNIKEGKELLTLYRSQTRLVQKRMTLLKREARYAQRLIQKEKDRIALALGNRGYIVKNGTVITPNGKDQVHKNIEIDVKFFE